jgi:hypothetical protein
VPESVFLKDNNKNNNRNADHRFDQSIPSVVDYRAGLGIGAGVDWTSGEWRRSLERCGAERCGSRRGIGTGKAQGFSVGPFDQMHQLDVVVSK